VANLLCGYYAVVASLLGGRDDFDHASKAIGFAILLIHSMGVWPG